MAIKVKHEMNAAPAAAATLAAGRARRSMETARMFASGSGSGGRGGGTTGAHASAISPGGAQAHVVGAHAPGVTDWEGTRRENAAQEAARLKQAIDVANANNAAAKERAQMGIDADAEKLKNTQAFTMGQTEAERAWRENQESNRLKQERELYEYKLTRKQKMELAAINDALEEARASGRFSPDEMAELEKQALVRRAGIKPLPTPREKDAQRAFDERIVTAGGVRGYINSKGDFEPFQNPNAKNEKRLTLNDVLRNVPTKKVNPADPVGNEIDVPMDERLDMAQKILDRMYPPNAAVPGIEPAPSGNPSGIDPIVMKAVNPLMFQQVYGGGQVLPSQQAGPYAPPPPDEIRKKWSAFRVQ